MRIPVPGDPIEKYEAGPSPYLQMLRDLGVENIEALDLRFNEGEVGSQYHVEITFGPYRGCTTVDSQTGEILSEGGLWVPQRFHVLNGRYIAPRDRSEWFRVPRPNWDGTGPKYTFDKAHLILCGVEMRLMMILQGMWKAKIESAKSFESVEEGVRSLNKLIEEYDG